MNESCYHTAYEIATAELVEYAMRKTDLGHTERVPTGNCTLHKGQRLEFAPPPSDAASWSPEVRR